jgi:UDP-GlcNAc:undecaprenyl-phosphate GlcNAc-1-phosphate transferase
MNYIILIVFLSSICLGLFINNFLINRPIRFLVKKANDTAIRWSSQSKPIFGGVSFYAIFFIMVMFSLFLFDQDVSYFKEYISLLLVVTLSFFMGLADDIINTPPSFKFIIQFLCAFIFIFNGIYIHISPIEWINWAITVIWVVGIMNSINMLDNMDAVTSITSLTIIGGATIFSIIEKESVSPFTLFILLSTCGALLSFLVFNWSPAKMYMGDNGSQFLGAILAFLGIIFFWNAVPIEEFQYGYNSKQALIVALAFIIPLTDTTTVTINRLLRKKSPFVGGRDHTTHHLCYLGLSSRWVAVLLFVLNLIGVSLSLYIIKMDNAWSYNYFWAFAIFPVVTFLFLYLNTKFSKAK